MLSLLVILLIIHGANAIHGNSHPDSGSSPFVVSIWYRQKHKCSGSIIDRAYILTVGHCVTVEPSSSLSVSTETKEIQQIAVKTVHFHPLFRIDCSGDEIRWENDIAVLELSEPLNLKTRLGTVQLIDKGSTWKIGKFHHLYGWEKATVDDIELLTLRWCGAAVMENEACRDSNVDLLENEGCLKDLDPSIVLDDEDYGVPVMFEDIAIGISIRGREHGPSPPVFLSIYPYLDFIASILNVKYFNVPGISSFYVAIYYEGTYICGGSIIDSTHILTAGHCVATLEEETLIILPGHSEFSITRVNPSEFLSVDRIQIHPKYTSIESQGRTVSLRNDIAVLTLEKRLTWSATISPIGLASHSHVSEICQLNRWSRTFTKPRRKVFKSWWSAVRIQDNEFCKTISKPTLDPTQLCSLIPSSLFIATRGDSGSPIVCGGTALVAVLSSSGRISPTTGSSSRAYYLTSIAPHREFINQAVADRT